jgi:hypothetical protein
VPSPLSEFYADTQDPSISSDSRIIVLAIKIIQSQAVIKIILSNNFIDGWNRLIIDLLQAVF